MVRQPTLTVRHVDKQLRAIGQAALKIEALEAELDAGLQKVRESYDARLAKLRARRTNLEAELVAECQKARGELFEDGVRTLACGFGTISYRRKPASLHVREGLKEDDVIEGLPAKLRRFIRIKRSLDKRAIIAAAQAGELRKRELEKGGLTVVDGQEVWFVRPSHEAIKGEVGKC
jgi:phage host-nuclease inhibitor protein Gam